MTRAALWRRVCRPVAVIPRGVRALLAVALGLQIAWQAAAPAPEPQARPLPPALTAARDADAPAQPALAAGLLLWLQTRIDQPGARQSFRDLDYARLRAWLALGLALDPEGPAPLARAVRVYGQVGDSERQRILFDWVADAFTARPAERWPWLAEAAIAAHHRTGDRERALRYARALHDHLEPGAAPLWARDLQSALLQAQGDYAAAAAALEGLLAAGEVDDERERAHAERRLEFLREHQGSGP